MIVKDRLIASFLEMLKNESPSLDELAMGNWLLKYFENRNIEAVMDKCGDEIGGNCGNIIAHINGNIIGEPLCFSAHMDQISPCSNIKPIIEGNIIKTDGTTTLGGDDKGGIAVILEAIEHILEEKIPHKEIYLLFTVCEEQGLLGCKNLEIDKLPVRDIVIVDASGQAGVIVCKSPAKGNIRVTFNGRKAHAGIEPENGINAIKVAAEAISNMHIGRIDDETTSNIGRIEGGIADNIVADIVFFTAEIRSHSMAKLQLETNNMIGFCQNSAKKYNATIDIKYEIDYPEFKLSKNSYIYKQCFKAFKEEGIIPKPMIIGGGSDANILSSKGYDCAIISVGMSKVHTLDETINLDDMIITSKVIARMMCCK